jgi:hypothetical protein
MIFHTGLREQRGRGIGALFSGLLRGLKPLARMGFNAGKRFLQSDFAKNVGKSALDVGKQAATNIAVDLLEGKNLKDSAQEQLDEAKKKIATTLKGGGGCSKKRKKKKPSFNTNSLMCKKIKYNLLK